MLRFRVQILGLACTGIVLGRGLRGECLRGVGFAFCWAVRSAVHTLRLSFLSGVPKLGCC